MDDTVDVLGKGYLMEEEYQQLLLEMRKSCDILEDETNKLRSFLHVPE